MNTAMLKKLMIPAALGLLVVGGAKVMWIKEMWALSVGGGEGKYEPVVPPVVAPKPVK